MKLNGKVVYVQWRDSFGVNLHWESVDDFRNWQPAQMISVGVLLAPKWLVDAPDMNRALADRLDAYGDEAKGEAVVVAPHVGDNENRGKPERDVCGVMAIPVGAVRRLIALDGMEEVSDV